MSNDNAIRRKKNGSALRKSNWPLIIGFLFPAIFFLLVFAYYPSIMCIIMAFQRVFITDLRHTPFIGLLNFKNVFAMSGIWSFWTNTFIWVFGCVGAELILGFTVAILLQKEFPGKRFYEGVVFVPWALSGFIVGIIFQWIFNGESMGLLNDVFMRLGLIQSPIGFLSSMNLALPCVMVAKVWTGMAFFAIILMAALKTVPQELYESASIDGAGGIVKFFKITLPGIKTILVFVTLLRLITTFGQSDLIFGMTGGGPANATQTVSSYIYIQVIKGRDYGLIEAMGVIVWLFLLVCSLGYLRVTKSFKGGDEE